MELYFTTCQTPLGEAVLLAGEAGLMGLWLPGQQPDAGLMARAQRRDSAPLLVQGKDWLQRYFCGQRPTPAEIALDPQGSEFRQRVWRRLCRIPYGELTTYGQIAREITRQTGKRMSAQAVGGAVGHNPVSLIIPCHRVVGENHSLVGYNGGVQIKRRLLRYEGVDVDRLTDPKPKRETPAV